MKKIIAIATFFVIGIVAYVGYISLINDISEDVPIARITYDDMHGLWGGYRVVVNYKENIVDINATKYGATTTPLTQELKDIFEFTLQNVESVNDIPRSNIPDSSLAKIEILYEDGRMFTVEQDYNSRTDEFKKITEAFHTLSQSVFEKQE